jgi:NAD(P) transhydrogenase
MIFGLASVAEPHVIQVELQPGQHQRVRAKKFLIATGTCPARPEDIPFKENLVVDSDAVLQLKEIPRSMTVVGAGVIGCEYAAIFACLGTEVTLIESRPQMLEFADREIMDNLVYHLRDHEVILRLGESVKSVSINDKQRVVTTLESGKRILSDTLLYSVGRQGSTEGLNLAAAKVEADERGRLKVNKHFQTSARHIYAAGDVIGFPSLASTSMEQGRHAACHALGIPCEPASSNYPYGIYTIPEISMIGETEEALTQAKVPYETGIARYDELAKGQLIGEEHGMLKLLFHRTSRKLLGVHIIGERATELIHIGQAVMSFDGTIEYFVNTVFNYPTLAEAYKVAALDGINKL